ncbi:cation:proton antiporter [Kitasatospora sp. NPDC048365]|uniref:cation:proton antiporter n=1 Tax=Kitasatospora sp. NPDC048365 TaxID=3364050 RepID=UPI0037208D1A
MTTDEILLGLGLTGVLAVGSQVLARRLRIPALIVLLPVGFTAGALTDDIDPDRLLGATFSPLVSLSVALILYDAGLGLDLKHLRGHNRRVVVRLLLLGVVVTGFSAALLAAQFLGMSSRAALMLGAILVVSGPTVVGPLLNFVRPVERLQRILTWEGSLIDPIGGILGALVFHSIVASTHHTIGERIGQLLLSFVIGLAGGLVGTTVLWLLLGRLRLPEPLGTSVQLATVIGTAAVCDVLRDDAGLIAAVAMGVAVANLPTFDVPSRNPFFETLVQLIIGLLFISISATITPDSLTDVALPTLGLVAVLVVVVRPLVAALSTLGTDLARGERAFIGWMAPRGIVAAATASTFSTTLVADGIGGAAKILPATFLVIVATVAVYGFTAVPAARLLEVRRLARSRPLLVGGARWVVDLGRALRSAGLDVLMWAGLESERERIRESGLELAPGELLAAATGQGAELEGITAVLLLTGEDDFNALASTILRGSVEGRVYRLGPPHDSHGVVAPYTGGDILFGGSLARPALAGRYAEGAPIVTRSGAGPVPAGYDLLFRVRSDGSLAPVVEGHPPHEEEGDVLVLLGPARRAEPGRAQAEPG